MNHRRSSILALAAGTIALGAPAFSSAAELGFYVGGQYGQTSKDDSVAAGVLDGVIVSLYDDLGYTPATRDSRLETDDQTWGFFGGYRLFQHLAFEAGYLSLSKDVLREYSTGTFLNSGVNPPVNEPEAWSTSMGVRSTGFTLSALGVLPITYNWELFARGGIFLGSNTLSLYAINQDGFGGADQVTESSADFLAGVGVGYTLAEVYQLRAEFQRIFDAGAKEYGETDVDLISIGVTVSF